MTVCLSVPILGVLTYASALLLAVAPAAAQGPPAPTVSPVTISSTPSSDADGDNVRVADDDLPVISIEGGQTIVAEGGDAEFTVTANPAPDAPLTVNLTVSESAYRVDDADEGADTVTVPTTGTATYTVPTVADHRREGCSTVTVEVDGGNGYSQHPSNGVASVNVTDYVRDKGDDDPATVERAFTAYTRRGTDGSLERLWVMLLFDRELSRTPEASAFTVTVNGVDRTFGRHGTAAYIEKDGTRRTRALIFAFVPGITPGQTVTVSYAKPSSGRTLQDRTCIDVESFTNQAVTNDTPPAPTGATVNGTTLTIAFDRELDTSAPPEATRFSVAGTDAATTVSAVGFKSGDATMVELTLSPAVAHGDAGITVTYTAGDDANPLKDADNANEPVADFAEQEVTNNTPDPAQPPQQSAAPSFGGAAVASLALDRGRAMAPVVLPRATGGDGELTYSLTSAPAGLAGLDFDAATRRLSGTPGASGSWTFTYRAEDADADRADSDAAVLTFDVRVVDKGQAVAAVKRTLARVAARTLSSALGHIGLRLTNVVPSTGLTLSGRRLEFAAPGMGAGACAWGGSDRHGFGRHGLDGQGFDGHGVGDAWQDGLGAGGGCAGWSRGIGTEELLRASAFSWLLGAAEGSGGADPAAARWAVWGRGDFSDFAGRPEGMSYDGKARSGWLGVDARKDRWVAGLALSHGVSEADYSYEGGAAGGRLETTLTALYPYGRWTLAEGLEVRGVLGMGSGEARHMPGDAEAATSDLTMRMGSAGVRRELAEVLGIELAARADASLVRMEIEAGPEFIDGVSADSWRARVGLEATRRLALGEETALTPFMEVAGRRDGGDGLEGSGLEVAGGVRYTAPRVEVEARGRLLAAHAEEGARERGVSVTARLGPGADGRGLSLSLRPRWGAGTGGAEALWRDELPGLSGAGEDAALDARIGYGVGLAERGLLTPFVEAGMSKGRRLRVGTRFEGWRADLGLELWGERRESGNGAAEHGVLLDLRLRF